MAGFLGEKAQVLKMSGISVPVGLLEEGGSLPGPETGRAGLNQRQMKICGILKPE